MDNPAPMFDHAGVRRLRPWCAIGILLLVAGLNGRPAAQGPVNPPPKSGTGLIVGRVVDALSGRPLSDALVSVRGDGPGSRRARVLTDGDGQFVLARLVAGAYHLNVSKPGFVEGGFAQHAPDGAPGTLTLTDGQAIDRVTIRLWKFGVVSGSVVDEAGEPVIGVQVAAFRRSFAGGRPYLSSATFDGSRRTDDRGVYRITGLIPGEYVVAVPRVQSSVPLSTLRELERLRETRQRDELMTLAMTLGVLGGPQALPGSPDSLRAGSVVQKLDSPALPSSEGGPALVYASQFYAGASRPGDARTIAVRSGEDVNGIDFALKPSRTVRVSGTVTGPEGTVAHVPLRLVPVGSDELETTDAATATSLTDARGVFTFAGVIAGDYILKAARGGGDEEEMGFVGAMGIGEGGVTIVPERPMFFEKPASLPAILSGSLPVSVAGRDVDGLALVVRPAAKVSGKVEFVGTSPRPETNALKTIRVGLGDANGRPGNGRHNRGEGLNAASEFSIDRVPPGRYVLRASQLPDGWVVESVSMLGRDVTDHATEIGDKDIADVVIKVTDRATMITGTVRRSATGTATEDVSVLAFPVDRDAWIDYGPAPRRLQQSRPSAAGAFAIERLPPGDYFVVAIRDDVMRDWRDPAFLAAASRAAERVRLVAGDRRTVDLTVTIIR